MRFNSYTRYYNGNAYDVHRRSVWTWQGFIIDVDGHEQGGGGYKKTFHRARHN